MYGGHFLTLAEYSAERLRLLLDAAKLLKEMQRNGQQHDLLAGKTLAMIFQKPSNRTRVSFEVGMYQLGGRPLIIRPDEIQLGERESIKDAARTLSRYVDGVMMRVLRHTDIVEFAAASRVPVINGLSDLYHPCQAVADLLTIEEHRGPAAGMTLCFVGDGNNVCNSLIFIGNLTGMEVRVACPEGYEPTLDPERWRYTVIRDPYEAVSGADVVYTDVWTSMGQEQETIARLRAFDGFTVTADMLARANENALFMHCLPAHRGEEVDDAVMECAQSVVFDQAENRLHAQKGILALLMAEGFEERLRS